MRRVQIHPERKCGNIAAANQWRLEPRQWGKVSPPKSTAEKNKHGTWILPPSSEHRRDCCCATPFGIPSIGFDPDGSEINLEGRNQGCRGCRGASAHTIRTLNKRI